MPLEVTRGTRRSHGERGNMMVAVAVVMVLGFLSAAVIARTLSGLKSTRQGQDFSAALANADAGLSDALFRMDQLGSAAAATFCVGSNVACTVGSIPGSSGTEYTARRIDDNTYQVLSKGVVNGQPHAIQATVSRSYTYPYVIFAKNAITFNGNTGNYDNATGAGPVQTLDEFDNVLLHPAADVATNGQVTCHGSDSPAHAHRYYKGGGTNCSNGFLVQGTYNPLDPVSSCPAAPNIPPTPCVPSGVLPCPAVGGTLPSTLLPGAYLCTQTHAAGDTLSFPSTFTVGAGTGNGGVIELFVMSTDGTNLNVSFANDDVNLNGDPTKLRIYLAGAGSILEGNGAHAGSFTGIIYAPSADATGNACKADWRGSIVVRTFTCNGGPHLQVHYDARIQTIVSSSWSVSDYTEIPSASVSLP
jgi:hypothetical protein